MWARSVKKQNITWSWNMDEMPLLLDMPMKRTMEVKCRRNVLYLNTGNERRGSQLACAVQNIAKR
jgi:hypothetical protein